MKSKEKNVLVKAKLTQPCSRDNIEAWSKCVPHGDQFIATDGMNLTYEYAFKADEMRLRKLKYAEMKAEKAARLYLIKIEKEALDILKKEKIVSQITDTELNKILSWNQGLEK